MSAAKSAKFKSNCNAVNSGHFITNQSTTSTNSTTAYSSAIKYANNGTKLNQKQETVVIKQDKSSAASIVIKQQSSSDFQFQTDVQKVLKQEQELQKQLYSGSNVAPGWLRVNHNNKVIYIRWVDQSIILLHKLLDKLKRFSSHVVN